jgi:uncharacterized membrane protein YdbT with pleckstrin-like domain
MEMLFNEQEEADIKSCPFCAEPIQARAVKCRFCNEFLNTEKARRLLEPEEFEDEEEDGEEEYEEYEEEDENDVLFSGRPSIWGIAGSMIRASFFLAIALFLIYYPIEKFSAGQMTDEQLDMAWRVRSLAGLAIAGIVLLVMICKIIKLKMTSYEVTADRIEWRRGVFDRRVDNLDMFRVIDLNMRRSLLDCFVGIGSVGLITNDKSDPEFTFEKIHRARKLYDIIKDASLEADKKNSVIHLE